MNRFLKNLISPIRRFKDEGRLRDKQIIAYSETDLWNPFDNKDNWILTAGKVENLRIACKQLNGLEIKANEVFSFWKHIGNPNFGKGYVIGREIREGCIVPTIAGGLCQLSNTLYDVALKANFDIIERHKHTKVIKGSLAEQDRDATVKWNYIDLRFKSNFDFRIETELTSDKLIIAFKSEQKNAEVEGQIFNLRQSNKLNDCYSCGNLACFKHPDLTVVKQETPLITFVLDEQWPEFDDYIQTVATNSDYFVIPLKKNLFIKTDRYSWLSSNSRRIKATTKEGIYRSVRLRFFPKKGNNVFKLSLQLDKRIAERAARLIPIESTHIVISQNLLPFVFATGALGGRTYDVLMTRLPIEKLHQRLDFAHSIHKDSPTLKDYRAPKSLIETENNALTKARKIITPHPEIVAIFNNKAEKLSWKIPASQNNITKGDRILFPASAIGRKGAYEIRRLAKELNLTLTVVGNSLEKDNFWEGLKIEKFNGDFAKVGLLIYPTYVEHQPRLILKAVSKGITVITTTACGFANSEKIKVVEIGNFEQLKNEVERQLGKHIPNTGC